MFVETEVTVNNNLSAESNVPLNNNVLMENDVPTNDINEPFTISEVKEICNTLKNNKACCKDLILNDFLKNSPHECHELITNYFNAILDTGCVPDDWCVGVIKPLFKNKGSMDDPDNYRGITLHSCMGKLFTALLNNRLTNMLKNMENLGKHRLGLDKGTALSTIYTLYIHY